MKNLEIIKVSLGALTNYKLRTALTMLGIMFGVGSVIAMLSISEGAKQEALEQIELMGKNNLIIKAKAFPPDNMNTSESFSSGLNLNDALSIDDINPLIEYITPQRDEVSTVVYKGKTSDATIIGTYPNYPKTFNSMIEKGRFFEQHNLINYSNVCIIGSGIKEKIFKHENPINKKIKIYDLWFTVIGYTSHKNISSYGADKLELRDLNNDIYIPLSTMIYKFNSSIINKRTSNRINKENFSRPLQTNQDKLWITQITAKVNNKESLIEASNLTKRIILRKHYGKKDFEIIIPEALLQQQQKTQRIFNIVMGAIAGISLIVGGIGIMNIMLANVIERTREIGIRKAVGATKNSLILQFIFEAVFISSAGGILGIVIGFLITYLITGLAGWRTIITIVSVLIAFIVSVVVGLLFGILPAKRAAEKSPIDALRYE